MIHGALPRLVAPSRRRIRLRGAAARCQEPPPSLSSSGPPGSGEWDVSALDYQQMLRRCEAAGKPYVPPYRCRIEDDTPIDPLALAERVCQEASLWLGEGFPREWAAELAERANVVYQHNPRFRGRLRVAGDAGQHRLRAFMRHWLCALLASRRPDLVARLPSSYASGHDLPPREQSTPPSGHCPRLVTAYPAEH